MNTYLELKKKQSAEFNSFPIRFAFSDKQFAEGMQALGLSVDDVDKVTSIGAGGFILKSDVPAFVAMVDRQSKEREDAIAADKDGTGYIKDMFLYELGNHEYCITYDRTETLEYLGLTCEDVENNPILKKGFKMAVTEYLVAADPDYN